MARPCGHDPLIPEACIHCGWMVSDNERGRRKRKEWHEGEQHVIRRGGARKKPSPLALKLLQGPACVHRGDKAEVQGDCVGCGLTGRKADVYPCLLPGSPGLCTVMFRAKLAGADLRLCRGCEHRKAP